MIFICGTSGLSLEEEWFLQEHLMQEEEHFENENRLDLEREEVLARQFAYGELDCSWPYYADSPYDIQEPEIVGHKPGGGNHG